MEIPSFGGVAAGRGGYEIAVGDFIGTLSKLYLPELQAFLHRRRPLAAADDIDVAAFLGRLVERLHDVQNVKRQFATSAMRVSILYRERHVRQTEASAVLIVAMHGLKRLPFLGARLTQSYRAAELVRIRQAHASLGSINFKDRKLVATDIKAHHQRGNSAAFKIQYGRDVGRNIHREPLALLRPATDHPLVFRGLRRTCHAANRAKQAD